MSPLYEWFASTFQVLMALPWLLTWPEYGEEYGVGDYGVPEN